MSKTKALPLQRRVQAARDADAARSAAQKVHLPQTEAECTFRRILLIDGVAGRRHDITALLREAGYEVLPAAHAEAGLQALRLTPPDVVIVGAQQDDRESIELCREIRAHQGIDGAPVLLFTYAGEDDIENEAVAAGATEVLHEPAPPELIRRRLRALLRHRSVVEKMEECGNILFSLGRAVEGRDPCISGHCERLALYSVALGREMKLSDSLLSVLYHGGYLHDIGKIALPDSILFKPCSLTREEWHVMETHPVLGEEICSSMRTLRPVLPIIRSHHEKWDGSGYPDGLSGPQIPLLARVMQFADVFDALTTKRPYKEALPTTAALDILQRETQSGWHDPEIMPVFARLPHDRLRRAAEEQAGAWQELSAMQESLENLRRAVG